MSINLSSVLPKGLPEAIVLQIAEETADAILKCEYKQFDALVKNFGCQITALEIFQKINDYKPQLENEALIIKNVVQKNIMDIKVSAVFAKLIRFRLLCIVNDNKPGKEPNIEFPITNVTKIKNSGMSKTKLVELISKLQMEEARSAAFFIQQVKLINTESERETLITQLVNETVTTKSTISSPLLYNTEAVLSALNGTLLIKNKLNFCGNPIPDRRVVQIFLKMPENKIINTEEALKLNGLKNPLFVIEGYINDQDLLITQINEIGIKAIVKANCATLPQYADSKEPVKNEQAVEDIKYYADLEKRLDIKAALNIDHMYCASLQEEIGDIV
jgi:hypothetical protein